MDNKSTPSEAAKHTDERETTIVISVPVTLDRVRDMLIGAFEGGSHYWCSIEECVAPVVGDVPWPGDRESFPHADYPLREGGAVIIRDAQTGETHRIDRAACERGLRVMAEKYWTQFYELVSDVHSDASTADVFLQCAAMGEAPYE